MSHNDFLHERLDAANDRADRLQEELDQANARIEQAIKDAFLSGHIDGLRQYAWWKDGVQYVGTCGTTLTTAIDRAKTEAGELR